MNRPARATRSSDPAPDRASGTAARSIRTLGLGAVALLAVGAVLWWTGRALPGPDTYNRQGFVAWLAASDPIVAAFAVVRLLGMGLVAWTVVSGALGLVVHRSPLRRRRRLVGLVDRLCLPAVRRLVHAAAGVALATAALSPATASAAAPETGRQVAIVTVLTDQRPPGRAGAPAQPTTSPGPTATPPTPPTATERAVVVALDEPAPAVDATAPEPAAPDPGMTGSARPTWRIRAGEHLWHVATAVLTDHLGHAPADGEVAAYLDTLVEANRHVLVVPTDPDLVMVGQVFDLPDPSGLGR